MSSSSASTTLPEPDNGKTNPTPSQPANHTSSVPANISAPAATATITPQSTPAVKPANVVLTQPKPSVAGAGMNLAAAVNKAAAPNLPKGLSGFNTRSLESPWFHGMIYSETSARKTTTAAKFSGPEATLIILCRQKEQLIPLRELGYNVLHAETGEAVRYAMTYPEKAAAILLGQDVADKWANHPEKTLVLDDVTEAVALLLESNKYKDDGTEYKDMRKVYGLAGGDLRDLFNAARRKPQHIILIALAKVTSTPLTNEETIAPDMPPSMTGMLTTDLEYVFFIKKSNWKFITEKVFINYKDTDEKTGKEMVYRREIFAKNKIGLNLVGKGIVNLEEDMDLRQLWERIKSGKPTVKK